LKEEVIAGALRIHEEGKIYAFSPKDFFFTNLLFFVCFFLFRCSDILEYGATGVPRTDVKMENHTINLNQKKEENQKRISECENQRAAGRDACPTAKKKKNTMTVGFSF